MVTAKSISWTIRGHSVVVGSEMEPRLSILSQFIYLVREAVWEKQLWVWSFQKCSVNLAELPAFICWSVQSAHTSLSRKSCSPAFSGDIIFPLKLTQGWVSFLFPQSPSCGVGRHTTALSSLLYRKGKGKVCHSHLFRRWDHATNPFPLSLPVRSIDTLSTQASFSTEWVWGPLHTTKYFLHFSVHNRLHPFSQAFYIS